jgi:hypothetical protein
MEEKRFSGTLVKMYPPGYKAPFIHLQLKFRAEWVRFKKE